MKISGNISRASAPELGFRSAAGNKNTVLVAFLADDERGQGLAHDSAARVRTIRCYIAHMSIPKDRGARGARPFETEARRARGIAAEYLDLSTRGQ